CGVVRRRAAAGGVADVPRDRQGLLRPAAGRRPAHVPPAAPEPLRRHGAVVGARVAARRRLERRARAPAPGRVEAATLHRPRALPAAGARRARRTPDARLPPALRPARGGDAAALPSGSASRSSPSTTTT